jgi:hypothetical protein
MPTILSLVLSLFVIFLVRLLLGLRKVARSVGSVTMLSVPPNLINFGSNLSGPFFLFRPDSAPGQLVMRIVRPIPYLNMGKTWLLSKKYEGTGSLTIVRGERYPRSISTDFAAAGQDVAALVISLRIL